MVFFAVDFFVADFPGSLDFPACLAGYFAAFVVVAAAGFAAFFFYPFFQGCANLYVLPHPQIPVLLPVASMK